MNRLPRALVLACMLAVVSSGCISVKKTAYRYYRLQPQSEQTDQPMKDLGVVFGPLLLPGYLDRPQIVTRDGAVSLVRSDTHRWAGPLKDEIIVVFVENLSRALGTEQVVPFPWGVKDGKDARIALTVEQLDAEKGGEAVLRARWSISLADEDNSKIFASVLVKASSLREPAGDSYESMVLAQSRLMARLADEIALALREKLAPPAAP